MVKSDKKCQNNSAAGDIYGGFTASKIRRLIRRAVIFSADFRRTNFRRRIRRSAAAEESSLDYEFLFSGTTVRYFSWASCALRVCTKAIAT